MFTLTKSRIPASSHIIRVLIIFDSLFFFARLSFLMASYAFVRVRAFSLYLLLLLLDRCLVQLEAQLLLLANLLLPLECVLSLVRSLALARKVLLMARILLLSCS